MKKNLPILVCLCLVSSIGFAKYSPKNLKKDNEGLVKAQNTKKTEPSICRITCSISAKDEDGTVRTYTATAGSIFTSCETAGERACNKAKEAMSAAWGIEFKV